VFFAGQTLEAAVTDAGRLIMTGQAQGFSQADFKTQVCNRLAGGLFDCTNGVYVNVQTYSSYAAINTASPISNGQFDTTQMAYSPGVQGSIVVVTLYYEWPIYVSLLGSNLSNLNGGSRLLVATSVFRNEPY
jgi:Flp pilus assembly protein TadG